MSGADPPTASFDRLVDPVVTLSPMASEDSTLESLESCVVPAFDVATAGPIVALADAFKAWKDIFSFGNLAPMPDSLYPASVECTSFDQLLKFSIEFVEKTHDYDACCAFAAAHIDRTGGVDTTLADTHLASMQEIGIVMTCARVQQQHSGSYLQPDVVRALFRSFPEYDSLLRIADEGSPVLRPPLWMPNNGNGVKSRAIALRMADAVVARMAEEQALGDVILVEAEPFTRLCAEQGVHFNIVECGWVFKHGSKATDLLGRVTDDHSHSYCPLNSPESKAMAEEMYGPPVCPQLPDMCDDVLAARAQFPGQPIHGLSEDVSRAYRRCRFRPEDCPLVTVILPPTRDGRQFYAIRMSHSFGDNTSAHVWGVPARALKWFVDQSEDLPGVANRSDIYVDDYYCFGPEETLSTVSTVFTLACSMAGDGARDIAKSRSSRELELLGWTFLEQFGIVRPNSKGWYSLLALFFHELPWEIQRGSRLSVQLLMRLGSYASRYSQAYPALRSFCHGFYGDIRGSQPLAQRRISARTAQDVWIWRMFLMIGYYHPHAMATPLEWPSLYRASSDDQAQHADCVVFVDAALGTNMCGAYIDGVAWCQFTAPINTYYREAVQCALDINVLEMIGTVLGVLLALARSPPNIDHVHVWCDNTSSVSWADSQRVHSPLVCLLLQVVTLSSAARRILVTVGWIQGVENHIADAISRNFQVTNGSNIKRRLTASSAQCVLPPPTFAAGIVNVSSMSRCGALQTLPAVHTIILGGDFVDSHQ